MQQFEVYISTGKLNAFYTLWTQRTGGEFYVDPHYICNLATDEDRAEEKARDYAERMADRLAPMRVVFLGFEHEGLSRRRGKLSVRDTANLEKIEAGIFPFGKHRDTPIADAPDGYILFFADKTKDEGLDVSMSALAAACLGVALERGLIAKRDAARAERAALDALSAHVGNLGDRLEFAGEVVAVFYRDYQDGTGFWVSKVRQGQDLISYIGGKPLGERGEVVRFRATVKKHDDYKGVLSTQVSRPHMLEPQA